MYRHSMFRRASSIRSDFRLGVVTVTAVLLSACGSVTSATLPRSTTKVTTSITTVTPSEFADVQWSQVQLPGKTFHPPGTTPTTTCGMTVLYVYYLYGYVHGQLALVVGRCGNLNEAPLALFIYSAGQSSQHKLLQVLYEGNFGPALLSKAVPTASLAASKPYGWSGFFLWSGLSTANGGVGKTRGISVKGENLLLTGKVIPVNGEPPVPSYTGKGLVRATYTYRWSDGRFRFVSASAGVSPTVPR